MHMLLYYIYQNIVALGVACLLAFLRRCGIPYRQYFLQGMAPLTPVSMYANRIDSSFFTHAPLLRQCEMFPGIATDKTCVFLFLYGCVLCW